MLALFAAVAVSLGTLPHPIAVTTSDTVRQAATWRIDPTHSELLFRVRHIVSRVTGTFTDWEGALTADAGNWSAGSVSVTVRTASISTNNQRRDTHLRSADFFEVEKYPTMTFVSRSVAMTGDSVTLAGELTIKDVTKPVVLTGSLLGLVPSSEGKDRVGFSASTRVNRLDYGLTWNRAAEGGGLVLGDDVQIEITISAVRQP
jgi:polyisoprenoid-binding protein YceI